RRVRRLRRPELHDRLGLVVAGPAGRVRRDDAPARPHALRTTPKLTQQKRWPGCANIRATENPSRSERNLRQQSPRVHRYGTAQSGRHGFHNRKDATMANNNTPALEADGLVKSYS